MPAQSPFAQPIWVWLTVLILQILQALTLLPWLMMAGLAVMAFDAPGSMQLWQPWLFVLAIWSYPLWLLLGAVGSWLLLAYQKRLGALLLAGLLSLPVPVFFLIVVLAN